MEPATRIMVVEDSETQAFKLRLLLEEAGYEVSSSATAESALVELNQSSPDLMVVDYHLPGMLGDALCRRVRMNMNTRGIPILMLTGSGDDSAEMHGLDSGADDYVSKSVNADILLLRIRALLRTARAQATNLKPLGSDYRRARLLAIDDNPTYLEFITEELRSQGYDVQSAISGTEGLELLVNQHFDCVLVDLLMPEMDGLAVCRRITEMRRSQENWVAMIMLTHCETREDMTRGLEAGADDFVGKSSDMAILQARIQALLRRRFFQEENHRIGEEIKAKEMEALRAHAGRVEAEARAAMAEKLAEANQELEAANRKLKSTQTQLIQTEKMASLGQLVAGIAHEINNPLAFVLNNLFVVEGGLDSIGPEVEPHLSEPSRNKLRKVRARLEETKEGLNRVKELVLDLRTFSRLDEGEFKTVDVMESIDSVLLLLKHSMNGRIRVEKRYGPGTTLHCYAGRLNQVLMNLISNAVDAMGEQGTMVISTGQTDGNFCISVRDSGAGIPEAIRGRIFDPFFTTKPPGKGTGLGLAISYGIVQDHQGSIEVLSEEGAGAEFIVRIPLDLESRQSSSTN